VLAYRTNDGDLPPQQGYPLRLVVPGWYGTASVKWVSSIKVVTRPFDRVQQTVAYRYQQDADDAGTQLRDQGAFADGSPRNPGLLSPPRVLHPAAPFT
jgi:DMSO/TMAO reductase YedYZ molybdopterin-dependent catalytic subunit